MENEPTLPSPIDDASIPISSKWGKTKEVPPHSVDPDAKLTIMQIIEENGFAYEEHIVVTEDGYELTVMRILNDDAIRDKPVVFL